MIEIDYHLHLIDQLLKIVNLSSSTELAEKRNSDVFQLIFLVFHQYMTQLQVCLESKPKLKTLDCFHIIQMELLQKKCSELYFVVKDPFRKPKNSILSVANNSMLRFPRLYQQFLI